MFRKKNILIFSSLIMGVIIAIFAVFSYRAQAQNQKTYLSIKNGMPVRATVHQIPNHQYISGQNNKYLYTFTVDGKTYASSTIYKYGQEIEDQDYNFIVLYALDKDGGVKVLGESYTAQINGVKYPIAVSYEEYYIKNSRAPDLLMSYFIFLVAAAVLLFCLYNWIWVLYYKNIISSGTLTYGIFVQASSKGGSKKYMSIAFRYRDQNENWILAKTPYVYTTIQAEKLMLQETFKIKYKNNKAVIIEDIKTIQGLQP